MGHKEKAYTLHTHTINISILAWEKQEHTIHLNEKKIKWMNEN